MKNNDNNFEWTKELIEQHLDNKNYQKLNIKDKYGITGFMMACVNYPKLAKIILKRDDNDIDFNTQNNFGEVGFILACVSRPELMKQMLNYEK